MRKYPKRDMSHVSARRLFKSPKFRKLLVGSQSAMPAATRFWRLALTAMVQRFAFVLILLSCFSLVYCNTEIINFVVEDDVSSLEYAAPYYTGEID